MHAYHTMMYVSDPTHDAHAHHTLSYQHIQFQFIPLYVGWLIDWLFRVLRPAQEYFTYMETSPLPVKGYKIEAYARRSGPLSREGSLSCHTCCDTGLGMSGFIWRTAPFSRLLRHARECWGLILTWICTDSYISYTNYENNVWINNLH